MILGLQSMFSYKRIRINIGDVIIPLFLFFSTPLYPQIMVSGDNITGKSLGKEFFAMKRPVGSNNRILKIITHEISIQKHEDVEVFREERDVEYDVKEVKGDYRIRRNVVKSVKTPTAGVSDLSDKYADRTSDLQSTFLTPRKVKDRKVAGNIKPITGTVTRNDSTTSVCIDKMTPVKDELTDENGRVVLLKFMGTVTELDEATETLCYSTLSDELYLDDLKNVTTTFGCIYKEKGKKPLKIKNIEKIEIVRVKN